MFNSLLLEKFRWLSLKLGSFVTRNKWNLIILFVYFILAIIFLHGFLFSSGSLGLDNDWTPLQYTQQLRTWAKEPLYSWFDSYTLGTPSFYCSEFLYRLVLFYLPSFCLEPSTIIKLLLLFTITFSGFGLYLLGRRLNLGIVPSATAGLFYLSTPAIFNHIIQGTPMFVLSYCLAPYVFLFFLQAHEGNRIGWRSVVASGLLFALALTTGTFGPLLGVLMLGYAVFVSDHKKSALVSVVGIAAIVLAIHSSWIFNLLTSFRSQFTTQMLGVDAVQRLRQLSENAQLANTIRITGFGLRTFDLAVQQGRTVLVWAWNIASMLMVCLVFSSLLFCKQKRQILYFMGLTLLTILFMKGLNPPFEALNIAFNRIPLASLFREVYHFSPLVALLYAILLGFTLQGLGSFITRKKLLLASYTFIVIIIGIYSWPLYTGDFLGGLYTYKLPDSYEQVFTDMQADPSDSRILFVPAPRCFLIASVPQSTAWGHDPNTLFGSHSTLCAEEQDYTPLLVQTIHAVMTTQIPDIDVFLNPLNIKYVIFRGDMTAVWWSGYASRHLEQVADNAQLLAFLKSQESLEMVKTYDNGRIVLFKNKNYYPHIYAPDIVVTADGNVNDLIKMNYISDPELTKALFFSEPQNRNVGETVPNGLTAGSATLETLFTQLPDRYVFHPSRYAREWMQADQGWTRLALWWWYHSNYSSSPDLLSAAFVTRNGSLMSIPFTVDEVGPTEIWAKVAVNERAGNLGFTVDVQQPAEVDTHSLSPSQEWVQAYSDSLETGQHTLTITNVRGMNAIYKLVIAPQAEIKKAEERATEILQNRNISFYLEAEAAFHAELVPFVLEDFENEASVNSWSGSSGLDDQNRHLSSEAKVGGYSLSIDKIGTSVDWTKIWKVLPEQDWSRYETVSTWWYIPDASKVGRVSMKLNEGDAEYAVYDVRATFTDGWNQVWFCLDTPTFGKIDLSSVREVTLETALKQKTDTMAGILIDDVELIRNPGVEASFFGPMCSGGQALKVKAEDVWTMDITTLKSDSYRIGVRCLASESSMIKVSLGNTQVSILVGGTPGEIKWAWGQPVPLDQGKHEIKISPEKNVVIDCILISAEEFETTVSPDISSHKSNRVTYNVTVKNATEPFLLVFGEAHNPEWKVYEGRVNWLTALFRKPLSDDKHFIANGYANAWYIDKSGDFELTIYFAPQSPYQIGLIVAGVTIIGGIGYLLFPRRRGRDGESTG